MRVDWCPSGNYRAGRDGQTPTGIVVHTTVGGFDSAVRWLTNPDSKVSAHYVVALDGRVVQLVDESDTAFHAGRVRDATTPLVGAVNPNLHTVGIEFEDAGHPYDVARPDAQYRSGAELMSAVAGRWGIALDRAHVVGHREIFSAKGCPGNLDVERLIAEASG